jgi:hypothetical protein
MVNLLVRSQDTMYRNTLLTNYDFSVVHICNFVCRTYLRVGHTASYKDDQFSSRRISWCALKKQIGWLG